MPYGLRGLAVYDAKLGYDPAMYIPSANPCTSWVEKTFNPTCWFRAAVYGSDYPAPPAPPVVASTLPGGAEIPAVPPVLESPQLTQVNAGQMVDSIVDAQGEAWQAQNAGFFQQLNDVVNAPSRFNWLLWGGLAAGVLILGTAAAGGGGPRRYGR